MSNIEHKVHAVPTNIITGFLGVGKTTVILNVLKQKPKNERWAVLVNEFGEVGVDGSLMQGCHGEHTGIFIREVPGGCMCCAAGLPMQIALNQLLSKAKPDRLLIEPTGLGHPKEVLEVLSADHYKDVLSIQQCITLVDARNVSDTRYTEHNTFNQQIDMADTIIGHKADMYDANIRQNLIEYVHTRRDRVIPIEFVAQGNIHIDLLNGESTVAKMLHDHSHHHGHNHSETVSTNINDKDIPTEGYLKVENSGEGYQSVGWRFSAEKVFNRAALFRWLSGLYVERAKGVFITHEGVFAYNLSPETLTEMELDDAIESRVEIISHGNTVINEDDLLLCVE